MSKLLVACLAVLAISIHANDKVIRQTLYNRRAADLRQLNGALENGGARNHIQEFTQIFSILRSEQSFQQQTAQIEAIANSLNDNAKLLVAMLVPTIQQNLGAAQKAYVSASPKVQLAATDAKNICINIHVLLNLNGQLDKLKALYDSLDSETLKELKKRSGF